MFTATITGRVGNDPVTREVRAQNGTQTVTEIFVAIDGRDTQWVKVVAWNGAGTKIIQPHVKKGHWISISASQYRTEAYQNQDGDLVSQLVLTADNITLIGRTQRDVDNIGDEPEF